jgi:hypothetical protein
MTAPTLVAFAQAEAAVNSGVAVTTASVSWQTNDVVVVFVGTEGAPAGEALNAPTTTGSGISFGTAQKQHDSTGTDASGGCWAAVASANSSGTFSGSFTHGGATGINTVIGVYIFRGSAGIGNSVLYNGVSPTGASLTPTGADGSICWYVGDWFAAAVTGASPTATSHNSSTPGPTASPYSQQIASKVTFYISELDDQTSAGAISYGITGSGTGPFTIIAFEAKAGAGGGTDATVIPPARVDVLIHP